MIEQLLGVEVLSERSIGGGCIGRARRVETSGGTFFVKTYERAGVAAAEAACLEALHDAGTSLVVPQVAGVTEDTIVLAYLEPGRRAADFDERFGRGLAELHRSSADAFGFSVLTYCGSTTQPNPWTSSWVEFYSEHRLRHQLKLGAQMFDVKQVHRLLDRLPELLTEEPPALIHGDLWSGNLHMSDGLPALIDPASYYAHREAELGMMTLMGGFSSRVYAAYDEAYPLEPAWRERNPLYELYHLMNHANLFGGGYVDSAMRIVRRYA